MASSPALIWGETRLRKMEENGIFIGMDKADSNCLLKDMNDFGMFREKPPDWEKVSGEDLVTRYRQALSACHEIEAHAKMQASRLAGAYMKRMLSETDEWKKENAEVLFEPFFIYEYLCQKGLIKRKELERLILCPDGGCERGMCEIRTVSSLEGEDTGRIEICALSGILPEKYLLGMGCFREKTRFVRVISDADAPLADRAAEIGAMLIDLNIGVCVFKKALSEKIFARDFQRENRYRVSAPENENEIAFSYPWNPSLHRQLFRAGAKWNGRYMAMPIASAENALDLIGAYHFYVESGARKRMESWHRAEQCARVMDRKRLPDEEEAELMSYYLSRTIRIFEDLKDE